MLDEKPSHDSFNGPAQTPDVSGHRPSNDDRRLPLGMMVILLSGVLAVASDPTSPLSATNSAGSNMGTDHQSLPMSMEDDRSLLRDQFASSFTPGAVNNTTYAPPLIIAPPESSQPGR